MNKKSQPVLLVLFSIFLILLSGCNQVIDDTKKSYDNAAAEAKKVGDTTMQKVNDIQNAAKKIQEAGDAIQKVTSTDADTKK
ncbi:hypothetical protein HZA40_00685 [Candidatus Peregrinibacteria bacterium]|nr:hypothetical protein [Candidatus Peregrinibacteria bacterium]